MGSYFIILTLGEYVTILLLVTYLLIVFQINPKFKGRDQLRETGENPAKFLNLGTVKV